MASVMATSSLDSITVHGMRVDRVTMDDVLARCDRFLAESTPRHIVTADASMVITARDDPEFARIVADADLVTPDGAGILWASRRLGTPVTAKVSGVDLSERLVARSAQNGARVYFFGAAPGIAEAAAQRMHERHPGANLVGVRDGFYRPENEAQVVAEIAAAQPDILLVALGIPRQEKFIARHKAALGAKVLIGVGGTLDVFSGTVRRAPVWMQKASLEWAYRLLSDPRQFKKRLQKQRLLPRFVALTIRAK
jgi:N-acetylglucosaminyldiphosphoundecaprenol N-acetyl-beta-D-mannosaminyltransferase